MRQGVKMTQRELRSDIIGSMVDFTSITTLFDDDSPSDGSTSDYF